MSTLLICAVLVAAVAIVRMTVKGETAQPATEPRRRDRASARTRVVPSYAAPAAVSIDDITLARRIRSGIVLALLVAVLGALSAAIVSLVSYALLSGLRQTIG